MNDSNSSLNFYLIQVEDDNYDVCNARTDFKVLVYATGRDVRDFLELNDPSHPFVRTHTDRLRDRVSSMQLDLFDDWAGKEEINPEEILTEIKEYYAKHFTSPLNDTLRPDYYSSELSFPGWDISTTPWSEYDTTTVYNPDYSVTFQFDKSSDETEEKKISNKTDNVIPFLPDEKD